ncbi:MAG: amidase domain-containing protein [Solirubrobacteraceae bacterium]
MPALQAAIGNRALSRLVEETGPAARRPAPRRLLQRYSRAAAAAYARTWAMSDNPVYGRIEPNDCTNFVSQALFAGGWGMVGGSCDDRKDRNVWWFNPMQCRWVGGRPWTQEVKASFSWGGAQNLYWFMQESSRGAEVSDPMDLEIGDVLQMDMGPGHYNAGRIGHSMIVTDKNASDLLLSYHEDHHLDEPWSAIKSRYPGARWYPWMPGGRPGDYPPPRGDSQAA